MLSVLLLVAAVVSTTAANGRLSLKQPSQNRMRVQSNGNTLGLQEITLPMDSHAELMNTVRDHPDWFVHMNFDGEHIVSKLPRNAMVGEKALSLLQIFMTAELESRDEDGVWESTEQHALDWSSLSNEDQMLIETISTKMEVDTSGTKEGACGKNNYVAEAKYHEETSTKVQINAECKPCAEGCEKCFGDDMDSCTKCQFTEGEDNFLVRLVSDPDVCFTEHQCIQDGKIPNRESWVCEEDENATGGKHLSDAELFEQGANELVDEQMDTYPLVNAMNKAAGGKSMNKKATAKLLKDNIEDNKKAYEEVQQVYEAHPDAPVIENGTEEEALLEKLSKDGNSAEADTAKTSPSRLSFDSEDSLLELKSTLKEAMHVAVPGIDQVCTMYKEGWVNNQDIHRMVGGVIFGYSEGKDTGLQTELDKQNSFGTIFTAARDWDKKK